MIWYTGSRMWAKQKAFTIVELLIVIVVIGILAAITTVAYTNVKERAATSKRDADTTMYLKAILAARTNESTTLNRITGSPTAPSNWSAGACVSAANNPSATEPKDLPKTHTCWVRYYENLSKIGAAAGVNLDGLRSGDARGNPYTIDENEGEQACPSRDVIFNFTGSGISAEIAKYVPRYDNCA
jgi:prepilin-type N-terminal cleavage/methylation domain-containing protein